MRKNKLIKTFIFVLLGLALFVLAGCKNEGHKHEYELIAKEDAVNCQSAGYAEYRCKSCNCTYREVITIKHKVKNTDDYISLQYCDTCHEYVRNTSDYSINKDFLDHDLEYILEDYEKSVDEVYALLAKASDDQSNFSKKALTKKINKAFDTLVDKFYVIRDQYTYAQLNFYINNTEGTTKAKEDANELFNDGLAKYRELYYDLFHSPLQALLFEGEDLEKIEKEIQNYKNPKIKELETAIDKACDDLYFGEEVSTADFSTAYGKIVEQRQELAKLYNYDNYYEYAHTKDYGREYDIENVNKFREYVIKYIFPAYQEAYKGYNNLGSSRTAYATLLAYANSSMFTNLTATENYVNYLKTMSNDKLDFYNKVNKAFKDGRVYVSTKTGEEAGFTTSILNDSTNLMYFYNGDYYACPMTVVHETGHFMFDNYYNYNDYDLFEVQSQTNEQLFLQFVKTKVTSCGELEDYTAFANLDTVLTICVVDEFEYAIYTNHYEAESTTTDYTTIEPSEYSSLFADICKKYKMTDISNTQWKYYCTQSSVYEISYAISLIPTICKGIEASTDFEKAKTDYINLLTFSTNKENQDKILTFEEALAYCNFASPFDEQSFKDIYKYFLGKDFAE